LTLFKANYKNSFALTLYCLVIAGITFILDHLLPTLPLSFKNIDKLPEQMSLSSLGFIGIAVFWLFFAGLSILAIYKFFLPHRHHLQKPGGKFLNFYFVFVLWIALFLTVDFLMMMAALNFNIFVSDFTVIIINIFLTFLINGVALIFAYKYLLTGNKKMIMLIRFFNTNQKYSFKQLIFYGAVFYIAMYPILIIASGINMGLLKLTGYNFPLQPIVEFSMQNKSFLINILLFLSVALIAPFFEEIIMRGLIFRGLTLKITAVRAGLISGLIFAAFHFNIASFLPIAVLGALFAWIYSRTGSLLPAMIAHGLFNAINFLLLNMMDK